MGEWINIEVYQPHAIQRNCWFSQHGLATGIHVHVRAGTGRTNAWWLEVAWQAGCGHRGMRRLRKDRDVLCETRC